MHGNVDFSGRQESLDFPREKSFASGPRIDGLGGLQTPLVSAGLDDFDSDLDLRPRELQRLRHHRGLRAGEFAPARAEDDRLRNAALIERRYSWEARNAASSNPRGLTVACDAAESPASPSQARKSDTCCRDDFFARGDLLPAQRERLLRRSIAANRYRKERRHPFHSLPAPRRAAPRYR